MALQPREVPAVDLEGPQVDWFEPGLKPYPTLLREFEWARTAVFSSTRCKSLVLIYKGRNLFHFGYILPSVKPGEAAGKEICAQVRPF